MSTTTHHDIPRPEAFVEMPGMRGIRVARVAASDGRSLEYIEATKDMVLPAMTHPSREEGRVLSGKILFMQEGHSRMLQTGDTWTVEADQHQGPHVVVEDALVAVFHHGKSAYDA